MRTIPLVNWYVALLRRAAQPRHADAPHRNTVQTLLYGSGRPDTGYTSLTWALGTLALLIAAVVLAIAGMWWYSILSSPLIGYSAARTIGTYRESYRL